MPIRHARLEGPRSRLAIAAQLRAFAPRSRGATDRATRELERKLASAVADERRRTARDIQAGVLQRLAAMRIHASNVMEAVGETDSSSLGAIARGIDEAIEELRETISSAQPAFVANAGVGAALATSAGEMPGRTHIDDQLRRRHPTRVELAVYYACREAIQNSIKHAGVAATATIHLSDELHGIGFSVVDDGAGFDRGVAPAGVGLLNIRERIESAGGRVLVSSQPGAGATIRGFVPDVLSASDESGRRAIDERADAPAARQQRLRREILLETDAERRRIMRDLHDGAQQRLVALRVRIGLASEFTANGSAEHGALIRVGSELDLAIAELRDLARGLLVGSGRTALAPALRNVTRHWPMEVRVRERNVGRHEQAVEAAVYGCVLETLQDARAQTGLVAASRAVVSLFEAPDAVHFVVRGLGDGFNFSRLSSKQPAGGIVDRALFAGGSLSIQPTAAGVVVRGSIPIGGGA